MIIKEIKLMKDECALDAIAYLKEDAKNALIFLHESCIQRFINNCSKDEYISRPEGYHFFFEATDEFPATSVSTEKLEQDFHLIKNINAEDISFTTIPSKPDIIFYIKPDFENEMNGAKRIYVPESVNPFDFILDNHDMDKTFILPKYLVDRMIDKKDAVTIQKYGKSIDIRWNGSGKTVELLEISKDKFAVTTLIDVAANIIIMSSDKKENLYLS